MSINDSDPTSAASALDPGPLSSPLVAEPTARDLSPAPAQGKAWLLMLAAGLIAGTVSWLVGEALNDRIQPQLLSTGGVPTAEEAAAGASGTRKAVAMQVSLAFGSLGAALGLGLGLVGGVLRGSSRSTRNGAILGTILGGALGAITPQLLLPIYFRFYNPDSDDMVLALLIQGGIGAAVGAAGGVAFGVGKRGRTTQAVAGGVIGALAGTLAYELAGALAFPLDETSKPIAATTVARLLGRLLVATFAAAGVVMVENAVSKKTTSPEV